MMIGREVDVKANSLAIRKNVIKQDILDIAINDEEDFYISETRPLKASHTESTFLKDSKTSDESIFKNISSQDNYFKKNNPTNDDITDSDISNSPIRLSFQLMTRAEPAELVIATINSLLAIKAADDEILIVDNNHTETSLYEPLAKFCAELDHRLNVHFYHIDAVADFKAGALNLALGLMDPNATHVVVVDSDYQALPQARASIAAAINNYPSYALLQFPQFYRDAGRIDVHSELNHYFNYHLYRPFNRQRALSTGTYAVIRRSALLDLGGWSGASLTEDAQMGVLMHKHGLRSQFIPEVIATGLLPTTVCDLMSQRRRWIYGNMQVLNSYFSIHSHSSSSLLIAHTLSERLTDMRAHFSQLSAWINFTGIFIVLHLCTLLIISSALLINTNIDLRLLLTPLYIVYISYALFLARRLWAYGHNQEPLNQQVGNHNSSVTNQLSTWALHLNFWELGALSWLPVLWGRDKPFICTPKQQVISTRRTLRTANIIALPKLLLILNIITAIIVAPFSPLYSPVIFICAMTVCLLKLWAARVMFNNYAYVEAGISKVVNSSTVALATKTIAAKAIATKTIMPLKAAHNSAQNSACQMTKTALAATSKNKDVVNP